MFKLAWDEKCTKIELAAKSERFVCSLLYDQNIVSILEQSNGQLLSETLTMVHKDQDSLYTPKKIFEAMLNYSMSAECILKLLQKHYPESNFIQSSRDSGNLIIWKDDKSGQIYLIRNEALGGEIFDINRVKNPIAPTVTVAASEPTTEEFDYEDGDDDDEEMYTSDESSESNDESSDDPDYYGSGHYGEWKSACRSLKKQKKRREREERRRRRLERKGLAGGERKRRSFKDEAPVYLSLTKTLLKKGQELRELGHFTVDKLAELLFEGNNKIKLTNILRIFVGLKIVKQVLLFQSNGLLDPKIYFLIFSEGRRGRSICLAWPQFRENARSTT